ncbi:hypothetical protein WHR41_03963 [Cladosporium halotolerans]|uniref:Calcium channel YVC1-like C-terminal transmembrane domain-containing protein n=1 Tax=Cladosporium halotolerans TaxID=1052096 RepID=A0AB34KVD5_9PEZI
MFGFWKRRKVAREEDEDREQYEYSPFPGSPEMSRSRAVGQNLQNEDDMIQERSMRSEEQGITSYFDHVRYRDEVDEDNDADDNEDEEEEQDDDEDNEDEDAVDTPLLPIFSAAHLDRLPMYNITHAIRLLIVARAETTLSWEQLRSPQISQFLVKPIQSQIRTNHFNRATLCALIANCLQFQKEGQLNPGNVGVSRTRALLSELLAIRLLREFTVRELIDALSYDFDPLQGMSPPTTGRGTPGFATPAFMEDAQQQRTRNKGARVSTVEIAIRSQAKRFLAHPLVVQHLEAIWAGTIVFHSEADNLHRRPPRQRKTVNGTYGTLNDHSPSVLPADSILSRKAHETRLSKKPELPDRSRRSVTLYDPHDASLFKLSRLRVPRYRQLFSTISFAVMLALYIAVLVDQSVTITPLEVLFWFWSIGYMLDEVIGFTEQGFGLYILSFWNAFDLGILLLFGVYYVLRLYGIVLADQGKHRIAGMAYDALGSTAILLFPRLFSVLDHYRYFSQLLIAFRLMAQDLVAVLILILISCSGFFVAFSLSFADSDTDAKNVAYALFQILMGFTPAAWDKWGSYNILGKFIMGSFLIICHFLIVTILITVLTNSFMAIVRNAEEEHQFLFAINTISMVKSDALFSFIAPTNVIGWVLSPLRYIVPFRQYVKFNRTIIKITHFPVLLVIFLYERVLLSNIAYGPTDLVERPARSQRKPVAFSLSKAQDLFSPGRRLREPSVISFHKDRALDEVFRRPYRGGTVRTTTEGMDPERRNSTTVVDRWMQNADEQGGASPPVEQPRSIVERLENRKPPFRRANTSALRSSLRNFSTATRSVTSDPDRLSVTAPKRPKPIDEEDETTADELLEVQPQETDADGDDEQPEHETDNETPGLGESISVLNRNHSGTTPGDDSGSEYFQTPAAVRAPYTPLSSAARARLRDSPDLPPTTSAPFRPHARNASSGTMLFAPPANHPSSDASLPRPPTRPSRTTQTSTRQNSSGGTGTETPQLLLPGTRTPKQPKPKLPASARPSMPPRQSTAPAQRSSGLAFLAAATRAANNHPRQPSFSARALDLASEIGDNKFIAPAGQGGEGIDFPASFSDAFLRRGRERRQEEEEDKARVSRIMLARMNTLEEGFREVLREIKGIAQAGGGSRGGSEGDGVVRVRGMGEGGRRSPRKGGGKKARRERERERPGTATGSGLSREEGAEEGDAEVESPVSVVGPGPARVGGGEEEGGER